MPRFFGFCHEERGRARSLHCERFVALRSGLERERYVAVAVNMNEALAGVVVPAVLLIVTTTAADPSLGAITETTSATGKNPGRPYGVTTTDGNDGHVPAGNWSK